MRALNSRVTEKWYFREVRTITKRARAPRKPSTTMSIDPVIELQVFKNGEKTADLDIYKGPDNEGQEIRALCPIILHSRHRGPFQDAKLLFIYLKP